MKDTVTVREYARLTTEPVIEPSLDCAQVSTTAFNWLCAINSSFSKAGAALVQVENRRYLRLDNFVGVLETPCGTILEILPKHATGSADVAKSRYLLRRMIAAVLNLPSREAWEADLQLFDMPLNEWIIEQFLHSLDRLIKRGVRSDYLRVESTERYLRGQLDAVRQLRQPPGREHIFNIRHSIYTPNRAENRLLKSAIEIICRQTRSAANWRLASECRNLFDSIPLSNNFDNDLRLWSNDRLMAHYAPVRPWCELILGTQFPMAVAGNWRGISLLFPMEKLFERYVEASLRQTVVARAKLIAPAKREYLCLHDGEKIFRLEPDILIELANQKWILDAKWKLINAGNRGDNYGLLHSDLYQLFAYGKSYLSGKGEMVLIYPACETFSAPLPPFEFDQHLKLRVLPFDLEKCILVGREETSLPLEPFNKPRFESIQSRNAA